MFDKFKDVAGNRFINCGIAEANMMSMAAGMGLCGLRPAYIQLHHLRQHDA